MSLRIAQVFSISESSPYNKLNLVNDQFQGGPTQDQARLRAGQLGFEVELDTAVALQLSGNYGPLNTTNPTLYAGRYQYVQLKSTSAAVVRGQVAVAATPADAGGYIVSSDGAVAANLGLTVGVFLNAITPGWFGWIQVAGLASVQFVTAITNEANGLGLVVENQAGSIFVNQVAATAFTQANIHTWFGVAAELPVDNTITRVWIKPNARML